jgi:hypothetical protein
MRVVVIVLISILLLVGVAVELALTPLPSRTMTFTEEDCSCSIPYNWLIKDQKQFVLEANRVFGGSYILNASPLPRPIDVSGATFEDAMKDGMKDRGYDVISDAHTPFQGHTAYILNAHKTIAGHDFYTRTTTFIANGFLYSIVISNLNNDPEQDTALKAAEDSFALLNSNAN